MENIMAFLTDNWGTILIAISAALNLASAIAALTRTTKDDDAVSKVKGFLTRFISLK